MHLSQPEGHAVISVKSCDRKSIALRKAHGKATALSVCSAFCFLLPSLHRDRAAWTRVWVLLTLGLSSSSSEAIQEYKACAHQNGEGWVRQGIGLLAGSDCLAGRLGDCRLPLRASISALSELHNNFPLFLRAASLCSALWCVHQQQVPSPGFHTGQDILAGWSGQVVPGYRVYIRHQLQVRFSRIF